LILRLREEEEAGRKGRAQAASRKWSCSPTHNWTSILL